MIIFDDDSKHGGIHMYTQQSMSTLYERYDHSLTSIEFGNVDSFTFEFGFEQVQGFNRDTDVCNQ